MVWTASWLFAFGILFAGSDGQWFPWPNLVGAVMIGIAGLIANNYKERTLK